MLEEFMMHFQSNAECKFDLTITNSSTMRVIFTEESFIQIDAAEVPDIVLDLREVNKRFGRKAEVTIELKFASTFPVSCPLVRIVYPLFKASEFITIGGMVCTSSFFKCSNSNSNTDLSGLICALHSFFLNSGSEVLLFPDPYHPNPQKVYSSDEADMYSYIFLE